MAGFFAQGRFLCANYIFSFFLTFTIYLSLFTLTYAQNVKQPNVSGSFYPDNPQELSAVIDDFLAAASSSVPKNKIFALISPHAGYNFSGQTASYPYKLIKDKHYKTVIIIGSSHYYGFSGVSVYPEGLFRTPLGDLEVDKEFTMKLLNRDKDIFFDYLAFQKEHSIEVQLPFLQKVLPRIPQIKSVSKKKIGSTFKSSDDWGFKIVPIVMGDCSFSLCEKLAFLLKQAILNSSDVLVVASTDMYHGYDYRQAEVVDRLTLSYLVNLDAQGLCSGLQKGKLQLCGGFPVVTTLILSKKLGFNRLNVLNYTTSAEVSGKKTIGAWTVGYTSCVIYPERIDLPIPIKEESYAGDREEIEMMKEGDVMILTANQKKRLLEIARQSIQTYLNTGKKLAVTEDDKLLLSEMGAFVTLHEHGQLRGCIGNIIGRQALYLTVKDMAVEAAANDPRFSPLETAELKDIEIEISVLSPLEKVDSVDKIELGRHGVLIKQGFRSGVFLPQVAAETGWSKEEFLSNLCLHKAGIDSEAWKDKSCEIYIFSAEVFSEKERNR